MRLENVSGIMCFSQMSEIALDFSPPPPQLPQLVLLSLLIALPLQTAPGRRWESRSLWTEKVGARVFAVDCPSAPQGVGELWVRAEHHLSPLHHVRGSQAPFQPGRALATPNEFCLFASPTFPLCLPAQAAGRAAAARGVCPSAHGA